MLARDALHRVVAAELATALPDVDDALPQYVVALVADGGDAAGVADALSEFLEERSVEFAEWYEVGGEVFFAGRFICHTPL